MRLGEREAEGLVEALTDPERVTDTVEVLEGVGEGVEDPQVVA